MDKNQPEHNLPSYETNPPPPYAPNAAAEDQAEQHSTPGHEPGREAAGELVQPGILVLNGQRIYATPDPTLALYELNRGITNVGHATSVIEFSRVEQRRGNSGVPQALRMTPRHIYNLHHFRSSPFSNPSNDADCFIKAVGAPSRRLGHLGLKTSHTLTSSVDHMTASPIDMKGITEINRPRFIADAPALWEVRLKKGVCKWTDMAGNDVAIEYDTGNTQYPQLVVTAVLERGHLDALVALWCCRVWQHRLLSQPLHVVAAQHPSTGLRWKLFQ